MTIRQLESAILDNDSELAICEDFFMRLRQNKEKVKPEYQCAITHERTQATDYGRFRIGALEIVIFS